MPSLLNVSTVMMCPHGGSVSMVTTNAQVKVGGDFAVRQSDTFLITGCPFMIGAATHPCVQVKWVQPAACSEVTGDFTLTEASTGLCVAADQAVQGTVQVVATQPQVSGQ